MRMRPEAEAHARFIECQPRCARTICSAVSQMPKARQRRAQQRRAGRRSVCCGDVLAQSQRRSHANAALGNMHYEINGGVMRRGWQGQRGRVARTFRGTRAAPRNRARYMRRCLPCRVYGLAARMRAAVRRVRSAALRSMMKINERQQRDAPWYNSRPRLSRVRASKMGVMPARVCEAVPEGARARDARRQGTANALAVVGGETQPAAGERRDSEEASEMAVMSSTATSDKGTNATSVHARRYW